MFGDVIKKKITNSFSTKGISGSLFYVLETSIFAMFVFFALNGFRLYVNPRVVFYGFLYGVVVIISVATSIFVYKYVTIAFAGFAASCLTLIMSLALGVLLFSETVTAGNLLRIALMLCAVAVSFVGAGGFGKGTPLTAIKQNKHFLKGIALILVLGIIACLSTVVMKYYTADEGVTDSNSLFFMTNVFSAILVIPMIPFAAKHDSVKLAELVGLIKSKGTVFAMLSTASSNLCSIVSILILAKLDVSVFTPISGALGFIATAVATPIVREKLDKYTVIATLLSISSVALPALIALF